MRVRIQAGDRKAEEADDGDCLIERAPSAHGGEQAGGQSQREAESQRRKGERKGVRIAGGDEVSHRVMQADRSAEIAVEDAVPVAQILNV
jgi:hypothetical protein